MNNNKIPESEILKGAEIELEHEKTFKKYLGENCDIKSICRDIAIDHLELNPNAYKTEEKSDFVSLNIPLFIRVLELVREDIKSDEELHKFVERVIEASKQKDVLTMDDYDALVNNISKEEKFDGGGLVAPNGKPSNLTPEQYKLVRTPEFKAWFGNFEKLGIKSLLDEKKTLIEEVTNKDIYSFLSNKERNSFIKNICKEKKSVLNSVIGDVKITSSGLLHSLRHCSMDVVLEAIYFLDDLLANSYLFDTEFNNKEFKNPDFTHFKYLISKAVFNGVEYYFRASVPYSKGQKSYVLRDYGFQEIKNPIELNALPTHKISTTFNPIGQYKDRKVFEFTNYLEENISKIVDENGEPLVCYNGTNIDFNVFKKTIFGKLGNGMYFTSFKEDAVKYAKKYLGDRIIPVFLKSTNLAEISNPFSKNELPLEYDGIWASKGQEGAEEIVVFNPNQIKLANGINNTFDENNEDIRFVDGGMIITSKPVFSYVRTNKDGTKEKISTFSQEEYEKNILPNINFKEGGKTQINSLKGSVNLKLSNYEEFTELVPVSELLKFREFDRTKNAKYNLEDSLKNIETLENKIIENGITEPLIVEYSMEDKSVLLIDGNHRLNVAEKLKIDALPVRVVLKRRPFTQQQKLKSMRVRGVRPDEFGYVPSDLKPSQIGIKGAEKIYELGGIIEGQLHSECNENTGCGEKFDVGNSGHIIEAERDEAVIVSKAFEDENIYEIKGTLSQIASAINVLGQGKNFDSGAEIKFENGNIVDVSKIEPEAKDTDVESIDPNSIIINRRSMADESIYVAKGTPKQIASQINSINGNGVEITDGGAIHKL